MKILVTGLCLSGNLGGPAMGITLANELKKRYNNVHIKFAIPALNYEKEKIWADYYGFEIVRSNNLRIDLFNRFKILQLIYLFSKNTGIKKIIPSLNFWDEVIKEFLNAYRESDVVIDMSGISYVGDGFRGLFEGIISFTHFYYAQKTKKTFIRFIQSFGPFKDFKVNIFAKKEFKQAKHIFARGFDAAQNCRKFVYNNEIVQDYPDIAILLTQESDVWYEKFLNKYNIEGNNYIICSPSAVINNNKSKVGCTGDKYFDAFLQIIIYFLKNNKKVVLLPHSTSDFLESSDKEICKKMIEKIRNKNMDISNLILIEEELNPMQAKKIISKAEFCIVSRYHALVAALSSSSPVISLGWNIKYNDILRYYNSLDCSIDVREYSVSELVNKVINLYRDFDKLNYTEKGQKCHNENIIRLDQAFQMLFKLIENEPKYNM